MGTIPLSQRSLEACLIRSMSPTCEKTEYGSGFSWGKSDSDPRRYGDELIFAVERKKGPLRRGLFQRLFRR